MHPSDDVIFYGDHSCAIASIAALEETGQPFRAVRVPMHPEGAGESSFAHLNPRRQVPVFRTGERVVRETGAILTFLDHRHPDKGLLPADAALRVTAAEWLGYLGGTVHPAFRLLFRPERFVGVSEAARNDLRKTTLALIKRVLEQLDHDLGDRSWVLGPRSALDFYLFVFSRWAPLVGVPIGDALAGHHHRVKELPAMARALQRETAGAEIDAV
jgi:glutathione S-transferase